jgi:hypothetical protein
MDAFTSRSSGMRWPLVTRMLCRVQATLFGSMKGINPQLMERLSQRLFFAVNKADVKHTCEGGSMV